MINTEVIAVAKIMSEIGKSCYLSPFISIGDKEPSWDGNVYLYDNPSRKNNGNVQKIPVQIKGTMRCIGEDTGKYKYSVNKKDLDNYKRDNGCLFFVVTINEITKHADKIYYAELSVVICNNILGYMKTSNNKSRLIEFREFPSETKDMEQLFHNFSQSRLVQGGFDNVKVKMNGEILSKSTSFTLHPMGHINPNENLPHSLIGNQFYMTFKQDDGISRILETPIVVVEAKPEPRIEEVKISIGEKLYYEEVILSEDDSNNLIVSIGGFFEKVIPFKKSEGALAKFNVNMGNVSRFDEYIKALNFVVEVANNKGYWINGKFEAMPFDDTEICQHLQILNDKLNRFIRIEKMFNMLGIPLDIDLSTLSKDELITIDKLIPLLVDELVTVEGEKYPLVFIKKIGDFKFLLDWNERSKKISVFPSEFIKNNTKIAFTTQKDVERKYYDWTCYHGMPVEELSEFTSLDYDNIYNDYVNIPEEDAEISSLKYDTVQNLYLSAIKSYDKGGINKDKVLELARKLIEWEIEKFGWNDLCAINLYQIYKRCRELSKEEREILLNISNNNEDISFKAATHLLLDNLEQFEYFINKMNDLEREKFEGFPIYNLLSSKNKSLDMS